MKRLIAVFLFALMLSPLTGSLTLEKKLHDGQWFTVDPTQRSWHPIGSTFEVPEQLEPSWANDETPWWERSALDQNNNHIHDSIESEVEPVGMAISYSEEVNDEHLQVLESLGFEVRDVIESVNGVLLGLVEPELAINLTSLEDVVMVHRYGQVIFYGDVQTQNVKARNSTIYPNGAWDFGVTGKGVNIAMVDTGVDNEHPGLNEKFVAGYDAVCYNPSDPNCVLNGFGFRPSDGTFDPDDGNQHGTACMGMAAATGLEADGSQSEFYGSAPESSLVDVRIGTDAGAGPFENYVLEQEFYESAMNGIQWIIDNKDTAWEGADESLHGIDIISLSWGITSHEGGGSDGTDMHSMILDEAMLAGVVVSVAAGNDGPNNDGLSGMGSSDLSITVGASDDGNTIDRDDDTVASYSSRGPRRDNGDNNPLNELKPEISAPGTNIIQAEGCVTSGSCNNFLGGDASGNTYTSRGSGTSYAAPAVSGILALMMEANENLTTAELKEIIKFTAERKGEATQPDVDPFWNRDFGWGIVDAYEATKLAIHLKEQNLDGQIDVFTQVHLNQPTLTNNTSEVDSGMFVLEGFAWNQMGSVNSVEYRIDGGEWMSASFNETETTLGPLERFQWTIGLDLDNLPSGEVLIEVRGISDDGQSLPINIVVQGTGLGDSESSGFSSDIIMIAGAAMILIFAIALLFISRTETPLLLISTSEESIEEALEKDYDLSTVIDAELVDHEGK
ncbi:MAG: S8 family serine peptidase [Candidatus Poseidoniaceae archaeon]|nr:S8 family serine peptidase [Candidatus Poseidoniaceae archaeon]